MNNQINHKKNKRSLKEIVIDGAKGLVGGAIVGGIIGLFPYAAIPEELYTPEMVNDFYQIAGIMTFNGAVIGAVMGLAGEWKAIYREMKESKQIQRDNEKQLKDKWGYIP